MTVKFTTEMLAAIGATGAHDFQEKFNAFVTEANQNKLSMAESKVTLETLQQSLAAMEGKIITEARIKELVTEGAGTAATTAVSTWAGSEAGKKIIGGEASRITTEALAAVGTTVAKPAPIGAPITGAETKTFAQIVQAVVATGKTKTEAISAAVESNPKEYQEYLKTGGSL